MNKTQRIILDRIKSQGNTGDCIYRISKAEKIPPSTVRGAIMELAADGHITTSKQIEKNGRKLRMWKAT